MEKFNPESNSSDAELYNTAQLLGDYVNHARREFIEMQEYATVGAFYAAIKRLYQNRVLVHVSSLFLGCSEEVLGKLVDYSLKGGQRYISAGLQVPLSIIDEPTRFGLYHPH